MGMQALVGVQGMGGYLGGGDRGVDGWWIVGCWSPWVDLSSHIMTHRFDRHRLPIIWLLHAECGGGGILSRSLWSNISHLHAVFKKN